VASITFRDLVEREYIARGKSLAKLKALLSFRYEVSEEAAENALDGTLVHPRTAHKLAVWAQLEHQETLDKDQLIYAPTKAEVRALKGAPR
jgi:hypothetical protein